MEGRQGPASEDWSGEVALSGVHLKRGWPGTPRDARYLYGMGMPTAWNSLISKTARFVDDFERTARLD
ncbi:MAG TPA: hypothetical protein VGS41_00970, partial [Chthonomonadales bacterium]|nr:hypothetical protein [Chthonomonadales bacterium]